jgi:signal transduction histidine kinase
MSDEDRAHIFERFFRGTTARSDQIAGTGLGLSSAKIIVDAHRGTITAARAAGGGTTIELRLPLRAVAAMQPVS